jgi:tartrate-resistant acid phosphatase type 5
VDENNQVIRADSSHFILLGDQGKDNAGQAEVAQGIAKFCTSNKCDAGILLGDNLYSAGMESADDPRMEAAFGKHYAELKFNFIVALGNHDYGKKGNDWKKAEFSKAYSRRTLKYYLPQTYYIKETEHAVIAVLDTNRIFWNSQSEVADQVQMLIEAKARAKQTDKWLIVIGHHPFYSNSKHGNAGDYERIRSKLKGMTDRIPILKVTSGTHFQNFFQRHVCSVADFYISGHDHSLQVFDGAKVSRGSCDTHFLVSGAGASASEGNDPSRNPTVFARYDVGFMYLSLGRTMAEVQVMDSAGKIHFEQWYTH